jgi:hypothetical protein
VVDSDKFSLCDLISDLSGEFCWGSYQTPKIWMFDKDEGRDVRLVSELQIQSCLECIKMKENFHLL